MNQRVDMVPVGPTRDRIRTMRDGGVRLMDIAAAGDLKTNTLMDCVKPHRTHVTHRVAAGVAKAFEAWTPPDPADNPRDTEWMTQAACRGATEVMFPTRGESLDPALAVCARCEVVEPCRQYAIDHDEKFGVWGGTSIRDRRAERSAS